MARMEDLHARAFTLAERERENTESLLSVLRRIEMDRLYLERGVETLHSYCTSILKYSEGAATRRVNASRLLGDLPACVSSFRDGSLNLSHLSLAQAFIRSEETRTGMRMTAVSKMDVLNRIEGKTQKESRRTLQKLFPEAPVGREASFVVGDDTEIRFLADDEFMSELDQVRAKNAHCPEFASIVGTFKALMRRELTRSHNAGVVSAAKTRIVFKRAGYRCQHEEGGVRCVRRHHLQVDHIVPRSQGGSDDLENLQALCRAHNLKKSGS